MSSVVVVWFLCLRTATFFKILVGNKRHVYSISRPQHCDLKNKVFFYFITVLQKRCLASTLERTVHAPMLPVETYYYSHDVIVE